MSRTDREALERWGRALREQRNARDMTQNALGRAIGVQGTAISNMERGERGPQKRTLKSLDSTLQTGGQLTQLWRELSESSHLAYLGRLSELEQDATSILEFQQSLIPSLLQTRAYAEMVMREVSPWESQERTEGSVRARVERATRFLDAASPIMVIVLDERIIRHPIDTSDIMREQLAHIHQLGVNERITLQMVTARKHTGLVGSFKVLAPATGPELVYAESAAQGQFVDDKTEVSRFKLRFGRLQAVALPPDQSLALVQEKIEGFDDE
ncbi:helix-turn-helix protein [Haloactinospora alba]|uniref:Helix-turn-helix protein n=1 Tax=Haloactinospora alba TaxID=405555 RepID=A0A543N7J3_9ACTN|nr:helix-turn-helix transcriptional regulator [Haloactinospora alba]TQN27805.1 helix-turn-helix protein [Haloactinospora alba]